MTDRDPPDPLRRARYRLGLRAELVAAAFLILKGYRVLALRYKTPVGEIDIVARRGRRLAFVEVKRRPSELEAAEAVTPRSRKRIVRAAKLWLQRHRRFAGLDLAFDAVLLTPGRLPRHLQDAFGWVDR